MNITTIGIDLAKNWMQIHGADALGKTMFKKKLGRQKLLSFAANLPRCKIYMEACGASNYWGRELTKLGHAVKLISPQYVKGFVKTNKNDANDAEAIVEAGSRPNMRFAGIKTAEQQDIQSTHRIRERFINQRTALSNQIRGLLGEYGIFIQQGLSQLRKRLPQILESDELSGLMRENLADLYEEINFLDSRIKKYDEKIGRIFEQNEACQRLEKIPGIGKLSATMLVTILGNGAAFKNGRHFAAFSGLVPRQESSGGKARLLGISKRGDVYMRKLLIHGARSVLIRAMKKSDRESLWMQNLVKRAGINRTVVAYANKMARKAWAVVRYQTDYQDNHIPKPFLRTELEKHVVMVH